MSQCWCVYSVNGSESLQGDLENSLTIGPLLTAGWAYLGREIAAEFELFQGQGHGVCPEEKDEGHECQVWDELAGIPKQAPTIVQTLLLAQQGPVQLCEVKGVVLGDQAQERKGQDVCPPPAILRHPTLPSCPQRGPHPAWPMVPSNRMMFLGQVALRND